MDPLSNLKNAISSGLSNVENWGSDVGNAVTKGLSDLFSSGPSSPTVASPSLNTEVKPLAVASPNTQNQVQGITQTAQQPNQTPLQLQATTPPPTSTPVTTPKPTSGNLVNYQAPIKNTVIKTPPPAPVQPLGPGYGGANPNAGGGSSIIHDITHNPVTNLIGGGLKFIPKLSSDYSNEFANLGNKLAGKPDQTIQQNEGTSPVTSGILKMDQATGTNRQLAGDVAQGGVAAATGGIGDLVEPLATGAAGMIAPEAARTAVSLAQAGLHDVATSVIDNIIKYVGGALTGGAVNSLFNAAQAAGVKGAGFKQIESAAKQGLITGPILASGGLLLGDGLGALFHLGSDSTGKITITDASPKTPEDVAALTQEGKEVIKNGGVIKTTDALSPTEIAPGPEDTNIIEDSKTVQDHKTAQQENTSRTSGKTQDDLIDKHTQLSSIPAGERTVAQSTELKDVAAALKRWAEDNRADTLSVEASNPQTPNLNEGAFGPEDQDNMTNQLSHEQTAEDFLKTDPLREQLGEGTPVEKGFEGRNSANEEAVNAARGRAGKPGTYDEALNAYMKADNDPDKSLEQSRAETTQILKDANVTPIGGVNGEFGEKELQTSVAPMAVDTKDLDSEVSHKATQEKITTKVFSLQRRLAKLGAAGQEMLQRIKNATVSSKINYTQMKELFPTFLNLNKDDMKEAWDIKEGKIEATEDTKPGIVQAVKELNEGLPKILHDGLVRGLSIGDKGANYMPHIFEKGFFDNTDNFNKAVSNLLRTGKADNREDAIQMMNEFRNSTFGGGKIAKNLELQRELNLEGYEQTHDAFTKYLQSASKRYAEVDQFGKDNGEGQLPSEISGLIAKGTKHGTDGGALTDIWNDYYADKQRDNALEKAATGVMQATRLWQLPTAAIKHVTQSSNIFTLEGATTYVKSLAARSLHNTEDMTDLHNSGMFDEKDTSVKGIRGTAPFLHGLMLWNRSLAAIAGKYGALNDALKGNEDDLRARGITGDLARNEDGSIALTDIQKYQAMHDMADRTIFNQSKVQSPGWTSTIMGKLVGQYRTAYTFKQSEFIGNLLREARNGNVAPLARYTAVLPVTGATVAALKDLYSGTNPVTQIKKQPKTFIANAISDSGVLSAGMGTAEDVMNNARYNYNGNMQWSNAAGDISPLAGTAVELGQNTDNAVRGNSEQLVKQVIGTIPGAKALENIIYPPKVYTPEQQAFNKAWAAGLPVLNAKINPTFTSSANPTAIKEAQETRDVVNEVLSKNHTSSGQTILLGPSQSKANAALLAANPVALQDIQNFEKSLPGHDPMWDLSFKQLQIYQLYESFADGDPNRTVLEQDSPFLINAFNKENTYFNTLPPSTAVKGPGYVPYPTITPAQSAMMTQVSNLSANQNRSTDQETQLQNLEGNTDLQAAYGLLDTYTNDRRKSEGLAPIPFPVGNLTPGEQSLLTQEESLPSGTGAKTALITANQTEWNTIEQTLANETMYNVEKEGGVVQQGGTEADLLKNTYNAGQYDIAAPKQGTDAAGYSLNPALAYQQSKAASSSGSTFKPLVPLPPRTKRPKKPYIKMVKTKKFRAPHIKKTRAFYTNITSKHETKVLHQTKVVKIRG